MKDFKQYTHEPENYFTPKSTITEDFQSSPTLIETKKAFSVGNSFKTTLIDPNSGIRSGALSTIMTAPATIGTTYTVVADTNGQLSYQTSIGLASGGTGTTVFTPYSVVLGPKADNLALQDTGAPDTAGKVLTSNGAGTPPTFQTPSGGATLIASGSLPSGPTLSITSLPATYGCLILQITGASCDTATRQLFVRLSIDNGTYDSTAANYLGYRITTATITASTQASLVESANGAATDTFDATIYIYGYQGGVFPLIKSRVTTSSTGSNYRGDMNYIGSTSAILAMQVLWNGSGNFDAGTFALYGVT